MKPKRALISVANKEGIEDFSRVLQEADIEIYATQGTGRILREAGIAIRDISEITDFTELMGGRVKTLHTNIYGGILARRKQDGPEMKKRGIKLVDLVVCNFYALDQVAHQGLENLDGVDIGGPSMVRAAAKNWKDVAVVTHPSQYDRVAMGIRQGDVDEEMRRALAVQAFSYSAWYDAMISQYLKRELFPDLVSMPFQKVADLRYGENPHQKAAVYRDCTQIGKGTVLGALQLQGKQLSYNNILDSDMALSTLREFDDPTCVIIKHATPSGIASASTLLEAWHDAFATDTYSPFGGIVAVNQEVPGEMAEEMSKIFWEVIIAPSFSRKAQGIFSQKKNLRLLQIGKRVPRETGGRMALRSVGGGLLIQEQDVKPIEATDWKVVTQKGPGRTDIASMVFAMKCVKHVRSNALVFVQGTRTVAIGGGQTSRVDASWIAVHKGKEKIKGSIMASDAFFPFRDAVDIAAEAGVKAIVQPGGSIRDDEVISAANDQGIIMVFSGQRCFSH